MQLHPPQQKSGDCVAPRKYGESNDNKERTDDPPRVDALNDGAAGWTANRWCNEAGISPTTVTRFLNKDVSWLPSLDTVAKLAQAGHVGMPPLSRFTTVPNKNTAQIPKINPESIGRRRKTVEEAKKSPEDHITASIRPPEDEVIAVTITADSFIAGGVFAGDTVIVRIKDWEKLSNNAIVVVVTRDDAVAAFRYADDWLIPATPTGEYSPLRPSDVVLLGEGEQMQRNL